MGGSRVGCIARFGSYSRRRDDRASHQLEGARARGVMVYGDHLWKASEAFVAILSRGSMFGTIAQRIHKWSPRFFLVASGTSAQWLGLSLCHASVQLQVLHDWTFGALCTVVSECSRIAESIASIDRTGYGTRLLPWKGYTWDRKIVRDVAVRE